MRRVYLYALDALANIVDYKFLEDEYITVTNMKRAANYMVGNNAGMVQVYAVDSRKGLYLEFWASIKRDDFSKMIEFADTIKSEGIRII